MVQNKVIIYKDIPYIIIEEKIKDIYYKCFGGGEIKQLINAWNDESEFQLLVDFTNDISRFLYVFATRRVYEIDSLLNSCSRIKTGFKFNQW